MCTRFVYRGNDMITGFNFDIDLSVWKHKVIKERERFYIGILRPDGVYHSYHGVNQNGNVGTLLYVHGNPAGAYQKGREFMTIADLTEQFILLVSHQLSISASVIDAKSTTVTLFSLFCLYLLLELSSFPPATAAIINNAITPNIIHLAIPGCFL